MHNKVEKTEDLVNRAGVQQLAIKSPNKWFLLEVIKSDEHGRAELLKIVSYANDKEELRDYLLESDSEGRRFIFYFSDPDKECEI